MGVFLNSNLSQVRCYKCLQRVSGQKAIYKISYYLGFFTSYFPVLDGSLEKKNHKSQRMCVSNEENILLEPTVQQKHPFSIWGDDSVSPDPQNPGKGQARRVHTWNSCRELGEQRTQMNAKVH